MRTVPLSAVASINPRGESVSAETEVSFVGMAELDGVAAVARPLETRIFTEATKGYTIFRNGDVLAAKITPCWENGKVGQAHLKHPVGVGSTEFHVLRPGPALDGRYLLHFLRQPRVRKFGTLRMTGSGGQKRVPTAFLQSLEIPLLPLPEQRQIAAILDHADALRAKRRQVVAHLGVLRRSLLLDLLARPFARMPFGELIAEGPKNGLYRPRSDYGSGTPIVRIESFKFGSSAIAMDNLKRLRASSAQVEEFSLSDGDLLVNRVNSREHVGKTALVVGLHEPTVFESNMMRIRVDQDRLLPVYAAELMQTQDVRRQVAPMTKDAVNQSSINQTDVRSIQIPLPPLEVQSRFVAQVHALERQHARAQTVLDSDDELFASLRARAFAGDL